MKTLNDMKHTQGKWIEKQLKTHDKKTERQVYVQSTAHGMGLQIPVAFCRYPIDKPEEVKANAKLIAAAPVMLNELITDIPILEEAIEYIKSGRTSQAISHLGVIILSHEQAIKKATE